MTRRFSISLPDDVAAELDKVDNASAFIAEAIRAQRRRSVTARMLATAGYQVSSTGVERMRQRLAAAEQRRGTAPS